MLAYVLLYRPSTEPVLAWCFASAGTTRRRHISSIRVLNKLSQRYIGAGFCFLSSGKSVFLCESVTRWVMRLVLALADWSVCGHARHLEAMMAGFWSKAVCGLISIAMTEGAGGQSLAGAAPELPVTRHPHKSASAAIATCQHLRRLRMERQGGGERGISCTSPGSNPCSALCHIPALDTGLSNGRLQAVWEREPTGVISGWTAWLTSRPESQQ